MNTSTRNVVPDIQLGTLSNLSPYSGLSGFHIQFFSAISAMHEILTIQFGHRANHIATHFWNTQVVLPYYVAVPHSHSTRLFDRNLTSHMTVPKLSHLSTMMYISAPVLEQEERRLTLQGPSFMISKEVLGV